MILVRCKHCNRLRDDQLPENRSKPDVERLSLAMLCKSCEQSSGMCVFKEDVIGTIKEIINESRMM